MSEGSNYEVFMKEGFERYKGKWVAICEEDIVSSGENAKETFEKAQEACPGKKIMIAKVPEEHTMIY